MNITFEEALERSGVLAMLNIELAPQQMEALHKVFDWFVSPDRKPFFYLAGFAGTGKSTIAHVLAKLIVWLVQQTGSHASIVKYACATGKAARVLTRKGSPATTVHALIYLPLGDINDEIIELNLELEKIKNELESKGEFEGKEISATKRKILVTKEDRIFSRIAKLREPKFILNDKPKDDAPDDFDTGFRSSRKSHPLDNVCLLTLDEVSMLNDEIASDLMSFKIPMLVLGDPGQLPPVKGAGYFTQRDPDFMLTEIHRQAADNPIIKLATTFREGRTPVCQPYGDSRVTTRFKLTDADYLAADQVLCGSNNNRVSLNKKIRALRSFTGEFPMKGERLVCLRNNKKQQIFNGQIFEAMTDFEPEFGFIKLKDDEGREHDLYIHPECFTRPGQVAAWEYQKRSTKNEFDFAYAMTVHKFQGSEEKVVLVYADAMNWMRDKKDLKRWCYTAATRASDVLVFAL